jgi:hypothetical protein
MDKLTIKQVKDKIKNYNSNPIKFTFGSDDYAIDVEFKPSLSLVEESIFIDRVCSNSFDSEGNYLPEYESLMFTATMLQMMSNFPIPKKKSQDKNEILDLETIKQFDNIYHFKNSILNPDKISIENKFIDYIDHLEDMVADKIEYIKEQNLRKSKLNELYDEVKTQINKFGNKFDGIDMKQFVEDLHKIAGMIGNVDNKIIVDEIIKLNSKVKKDNIVNIKDVK